jgi:hypothetical protein
MFASSATARVGGMRSPIGLESLGSNRLSAMAPVTGRPRALIRRERHDNDIDSGRSARYRRWRPRERLGSHVQRVLHHGAGRHAWDWSIIKPTTGGC